MMAISGNASDATAHISAAATGFGTDETWLGLVIDRAIGVPADGNYVCATGLLRAGGDNSAAYAITNGVVSQGWMCSGAVVIPSNVTSFGSMAFYMSSITSITIPASVTSIGDSAFRFTSLTSITIPATVTTIGDYAFAGAPTLASIAVDSANQSFSSIDGALFNKSATTLIQYPAGNSSASYTIPVSVTSIGKNAFQNATALTSITIGANTTSIGIDAFRGANSLASVTIPAALTSIGTRAFYDARTLKDVNFLGNAPTSIGADAFGYIGSDAKAHIRVNASGFGAPSSTWNGLLVQADLYEVTYSAGSGSVVSSALFLSGDLIQTAPVSTRAGYTLSGWSTSANGNVITFPYTVTSDITLHAIWKSTNTTPKSATKSATTSYSAVFSAGSSVVTQTSKTAIKKMVSKSGKDAKFTITGIATKSTGVPDSRVKGLAKARAEKVSAYLVKLGVKKSNITIKVKIVASGITPKTDILAKYVTK
jgi:uncharacterized repeat protein (TIGR02543 family)